MDPAGSQIPSSVLASNAFFKGLSQKFQFYLDKTAPHVTARWVGLFTFILLYAIRVYMLQGFYIVTYALGIYNLNLLLGFLTPQVDPELEGPTLPSRAEEEFRPFVRRLPEFKAWYSSSKAFLYGFLATFFSIFDVPVFWPILLIYFLVLFFITIKRQIRHMIKHKYLPFDIGKKKYKGGKAPPKSSK